MQEQLLEWVGRFSYPAVYVLLAATGVGLPISEDVTLLAAGGLCASGHARLGLMLPAAWAGVFTGDSLLFRIGLALGPKVIEHRRLKGVLTAERVAKVRERFARYGLWALAAARFVPGLRIATFLLAGPMGVTQRRFWLVDGVAAAIFAPGLVLLGDRFGPAALPYVRTFGGYALAAVVLAALGWWLWSRLRRRSS